MTESPMWGAPRRSDGSPSNPLLEAAYRFVTIANTLTDESQTWSAFIEVIQAASGCNRVGIRLYDEETCLVFGTPAGFSNGFMVLENEVPAKKRCLCSRVLLRQTDHALPCFTAGGSFCTNNAQKTIGALNEHVAQRHSAERDLNHNQLLLQRVFEAISDPLILMDEKARVTMVNQAAQAYYGVEIIEKAILHICFEGLGRFRTPCQSCRIPAAVAQGRRMEFEREGFRNRQRTEMVELFPVKDGSGRPKGAIMRVHDITGAKATEQQVAAIQNQASVGMLVSSVAHEIKNPNSFIAFNISVLQEYFKDLLPVLDRHAAAHPDFKVTHLPYEDFRTDVFKLMDAIERGSRRIDSFLGNLTEMGPKKPVVKCSRLALADIIAKVLDTVSGKIERTVKHFNVQIDSHLSDIYSDAGILEQVLINLLINAAQAADKAEAFINLNARPHPTDPQRVVITVDDNGHGMDAQTLSRIFEPYYSTKIAEGGTGLGLYVCRNLLNTVGGELTVESEPGKGTCFTVDLPTQAPLCRGPNDG